MKTTLLTSSLAIGLLFVAGCGSSGAKSPNSNGQGGDGSGNANGNDAGKSSGSGGKTASGGKDSGSGDAATGNLPNEVPPRSEPGSCGLEKPAFCDNFEKASPGGRSGDLNESDWSFSRWGHLTTQHFVRVPSSTEPDRTITSTFCGKTFSGLLPPGDAVICDGIGVDGLTTSQFNEVYNDQGDFAFNSLRARQLFDFTDRTGTVVFDVDAKINPKNLGHGWWVEFWITDDSAPMPYHEAPGIVPYPKNGLGINFQGLNDCPQGREASEVSRVFVTHDHEIIHDYPGFELIHDPGEARCFKAKDTFPNRFKIMVTKDTVEVWGSNYDDGENLHRMIRAESLDLNFTRGYIHMQHSAYNAPKDGDVTAVQTYRWDNIGFDGPSYALPRGYSAPNNTEPDKEGKGGLLIGYILSDKDWVSIPFEGVELKDAMNATLDLNLLADSNRTLQYRFNGGPTHDHTVPKYAYSGSNREGMRGFSLPVDLADLTDGDNTLEVKMSSPIMGGSNTYEYVGNVDLTVNVSQ